jgi:transcriptional regulator with XRE-family HTH domain
MTSTERAVDGATSRQRKAIGLALKTRRRERRLTLQRVKSLTGFSLAKLWRLETGSCRARLEDLQVLGKILKMPVESLLTAARSNGSRVVRAPAKKKPARTKKAPKPATKKPTRKPAKKAKRARAKTLREAPPTPIQVVHVDHGGGDVPASVELIFDEFEGRFATAAAAVDPAPATPEQPDEEPTRVEPGPNTPTPEESEPDDAEEEGDVDEPGDDHDEHPGYPGEPSPEPSPEPDPVKVPPTEQPPPDDEEPVEQSRAAS